MASSHFPDSAKQKLHLEYLLSSSDIFVRCKPIIRADYFDPEYRRAVQFIDEYYDKYSALPSTPQVAAETGLNLTLQPIAPDKIRATTEGIETFCRRKALEKQVYSAPELIAQGKYDEVLEGMKQAVMISLQRDLGLDYFADPLGRLEKQALQPLRTPMGFTPIDDLMNGGLARTEAIMFCANSGVGKSITLANLAYNFVHRKLNVLYITLELSEELTAQRFDIMFSGIPSVLTQREYRTIAYKVGEASRGLGHLTIKWMASETTSNEMRSYLREYILTHGFAPDLLIVDYLDKMGTNQKMSYENIWVRDKYASEQLYDLGKEYNAFVATASQLNRGAIEADEIHQGHTAGGISKVNTIDWQWAIVQTPAMKAAGDIMYSCLKSRSSDAVGKSVYMIWNNQFLRVENPKNENTDDSLKQAIQEKKTMKGLPSRSGKSVLDIMDMT